ncbi:MAG TPA: RNA 2',3'-cyclic phosphodiesterase [Stenotrophobium sp.]|nr:RNA 2',3'-cyclic phosphodiesterase [Stenotrophobium sp.]
MFFALVPDVAARAACEGVARDLRLRMQPQGRWINPLRYHMTLLFLGDEVAPAQEQKVIEVAHRVSSPPFMLTLNQAMGFRNREIPWVLTPQEVPRELIQLHDRLRDALRAAAVPPERLRFSPHLTVLRNSGQMLPLTQVGPVSWPVGEFVLIRSVLQRQPAQYQVLGRWPLNGVAGADTTPAQMNLWEN